MHEKEMVYEAKEEERKTWLVQQVIRDNCLNHRGIN